MPLIPSQEPPYYQTGDAITTKFYRAILNADALTNPTAIELQNTLDETVTWTRQTTGEWQATKTTPWPTNKTFVQTQVGADPFVIQIDITAGIITLHGLDDTWGAMDTMVQVMIEIITFP